MTIEIFLLALVTAVRPTSLAATYALLASPTPRRLMTAYVVAGMAFTIAFGLIVVLTLGGITVGSGSSRARSNVEIVSGIVLLVLAAMVRSGRLASGLERVRAPRPPGRWDRLLERHRTLRTAALAGPATHLPGIFYLLALNLIAAGSPARATAVADVLLFNVIWFALPLIALAVSIVSPQLAYDGIGAVNAWAGRHTRGILLAGLTGMGILLVVTGLASR